MKCFPKLQLQAKFLYNIATKTCEENTGKSVNPLVLQWQPTIASANFPGSP